MTKELQITEYPLAGPEDINLAYQVVRSSSTQQRRLVLFLLRNQGSSTVQVNQGCAIANVSDVARKTNPHLFRKGLYIYCIKPATPFPNRFKEPSQMYKWHIAKIPNSVITKHYGRHGIVDDDTEDAAA